ncbi:hypothetical protein VP01_3098g1 [Puccinia sorghi]|uniref:Uncharacterized protein n=1 Tax=Puccinia sorghi TaxID=27349 RepID=A0A0L6UZH7_9BASI|nr:hypothetical protein VP01_3098g1 [Puccinia sorghi]
MEQAKSPCHHGLYRSLEIIQIPRQYDNRAALDAAGGERIPDWSTLPTLTRSNQDDRSNPFDATTPEQLHIPRTQGAVHRYKYPSSHRIFHLSIYLFYSPVYPTPPLLPDIPQIRSLVPILPLQQICHSYNEYFLPLLVFYRYYFPEIRIIEHLEFPFPHFHSSPPQQLFCRSLQNIQKVPGSFCCYSNHAPKVFQPRFEAHLSSFFCRGLGLCQVVEGSHCKKNLLNCLQLTCGMLQPSFHTNSICLHVMVGVTTEASWVFLHFNCRQLSKFFFAVSCMSGIVINELAVKPICHHFNLCRVHPLQKKLAQLPSVGMQKVPGSFCCYSNNSQKVIKPSFDANSLMSKVKMGAATLRREALDWLRMVRKKKEKNQLCKNVVEETRK